MITQIGIDNVPYSQTPYQNQEYVGWVRNGEKPLSGGNADGDYSGLLNRVGWHLYNNIDTIRLNTTNIASKLNETITEVNDLRDLFNGIQDFTDLTNTVNSHGTRLDTLETNYTTVTNNINTLQTDLQTTNDDLSTLDTTVQNVNTTVGENSTKIQNIEDGLGTRDPADTTTRNLYEDVFFVKTEIGNEADYNIDGNVDLGNPASGIKSSIQSISISLNENETAIETNQQDITKLQEQVGDDTVGSETGLELKTKVLESEVDRIITYGGIRLSTNSAETVVSTAGIFVPLSIDDSVAMPVNRNVAILDQDKVITSKNGDFVLAADIFLNSSLVDEWAEIQIYVNGLPSGISSYFNLHNDGRGYGSISEPIKLEADDEVSLRLTLLNSTGTVTVEDFSLYIQPL